MQTVRGRLQDVNRRLESGELSPRQWAEAFDKELHAGHIEAVRLGRALGGAEALPDNELEDFARGIKDNEAQWLQAFQGAIEAKDDRYFDADGNIKPGSLESRTDLYVGKMRGSANDAFRDASDPDAEFDWELGGNEDHCDDCPQIAAASPYRQDTLYTTPGAGDTECLGNCTCVLVRGDGIRGFDRVDLGGDAED